jgi:FAD/FMN-containing dehydrogenase
VNVATATGRYAGNLEPFLQALSAAGFGGEIDTDIGARVVGATDNSIYQVIPEAIAYPRSGDDIDLLVKTAIECEVPISLTARGGNTGTNGQSLNSGLIVDFGRHMRGILALDLAASTVTVEPGVVLDQLNTFLAPHGRFFPPMVSTASRATIGGMVATDASGKGSRRWGKTSDYIAAMDIVLADGTQWRAEPLSCAQAEAIAAGQGMVADIHREALRITRDRADVIAEVFPQMNRGLTGYNLQKLYQADCDQFFLGYLLAGSEGTLALTRTITLKVVPKPVKQALVVVRYSSFDEALRDVSRLVLADPAAIEIIDDKVLGVAQSDIIWLSVEKILGGSIDHVSAMNFVEFTGADDAEIEAGLRRLEVLLNTKSSIQYDFSIVRDLVQIADLWKLREKSVGLLARLGGGRQGTPFVEDTAVPPERLADYVAEFRALLDRYGLQYGMFGPPMSVACTSARSSIFATLNRPH